MIYIVAPITFIAAILLIFLDLNRKINLMHPVITAAFLLVGLNFILWIQWIRNQSVLDLVPGSVKAGCFSAAVILLIYLTIRLAVFPIRDNQPVSIRLKIMLGGRFIAYTSLWGMILEILFIILFYQYFQQIGITNRVLAYNLIFSGVALFLLLWNGILRMFFTSRRLSIIRRIVMVLTMWIPVVNLIVLAFACRIVYEEYDFACYKQNIHNTRVELDLCKTRYPIVLIHGILFRDLKYFNYWGRVPKELIRCGASIYYGHHEAADTIAHNARDIQARILEILQESGAEKVNIIAHSKGGLDTRYAIQKLGMSDVVASLTTINTPHRGTRLVDFLCKMPDKCYCFLSNLLNRFLHTLGDEKPDVYASSKELTTTFCADLNAEVKDAPNVYYQSYVTTMRNPLSDPMLAIPYSIMKYLEGENDGLVSVTSAAWGNFRGVIRAHKMKGISHGDIIDFKRADYTGFDVIETYVSIVAELKEMGY